MSDRVLSSAAAAVDDVTVLLSSSHISVFVAALYNVNAELIRLASLLS